MSQIVAEKRITQKRMKRIVNEVAPLVARGLNCYQIGEIVGISHMMAANDMNIVRQMWVDNSKEDLESVRADGIHRWEALFHTAMEGYEASIREGRRDPKFLSAAGTFVKEQQRLQGLAADITLAQTNIHLHGEASSAEILSAFSPMSPDEYSALTEAGASLTQLPPSAGHSGALERHSQAIEAIHAAGEEEPCWGDQGAIHSDPLSGHSQEPAGEAGAPQSKGPRKVAHPLGARFARTEKPAAG